VKAYKTIINSRGRRDFVVEQRAERGPKKKTPEISQVRKKCIHWENVVYGEDARTLPGE